HGIVLDLGPGAGTQLDRFNAARVAHAYGVEPNTAFAPAFNDRLRETALGLDGKYTLVPCSVEDGEALARFGVVEGSIDCVVCMQVLCSVPHPEEQARHLYRLLKPGGELLFWEHCRNTDVVTRAVQWLWGLVWPSVFGGCRLDRVTKEALVGAGVWQSVEIETSMEPHDLMPRIWGRLVKPAAA
ncbi:S-adenosyl-L-methionine-dependent methyltransferase, partial [Diaporthe sp. PMI_573]